MEERQRKVPPKSTRERASHPSSMLSWFWLCLSHCNFILAGIQRLKLNPWNEMTARQKKISLQLSISCLQSIAMWGPGSFKGVSLLTGPCSWWTAPWLALPLSGSVNTCRRAPLMSRHVSLTSGTASHHHVFPNCLKNSPNLRKRSGRSGKKRDRENETRLSSYKV